jgi:hypothetical protein
VHAFSTNTLQRQILDLAVRVCVLLNMTLVLEKVNPHSHQRQHKRAAWLDYAVFWDLDRLRQLIPVVTVAEFNEIRKAQKEKEAAAGSSGGDNSSVVVHHLANVAWTPSYMGSVVTTRLPHPDKEFDAYIRRLAANQTGVYLRIPKPLSILR